MRIIKKIVFGILAFIVLLLIVALFIPKDYTVSVSTIINQPKAVVFDYVKLIKNQEEYSVWVMQDPNVVMTYTGVDGTQGFKAAWNSKDDNVGEGSQQIAKITDDRIDVDLHFERPMKGDDKAAIIVEAVSENQTKVTNEFYGHAAYPMNLMSIIGKKFITDAQTQNLANLKKILEE
ncbi:SRPBCC family protein [Flavobacterium sp. GSA192]|uniref:SRPBCC family protein n=1 Tax=Flavobacterium sp. GSA192 TaxID=2576304 RepID=UPI00112EEFC2|nr:SRPBCC family protein [Flavobacterium sp. GSA192]